MPRTKSRDPWPYGLCPQHLSSGGVTHLDPNSLPAALGALSEPLQLIRNTAAEIGVSPRTLFLGFAREFLPGAHPIVGCETDSQLEGRLIDWNEDQIDVAALAPLVGSLPTLDAELVDPSRWPQSESISETANQTSPGSIANMAR